MNSTNENRPNDLAMWKKLDRNGKEYFSATVTINGEKHKFNVFSNQKTNELQPDFKSSAPKKDIAPGPLAQPDSNDGF